MGVEGRRDGLIQDLQAARAAVLQAVSRVPPGAAEVIFLGTWSIKDLLAHLEGWDYTNLQSVREILAGQPPTFFQFHDKDWQSYNARLVQQFQRDSMTDLLADLAASHQELITYLQTIPARDLTTGKVACPNGRTITIRNLLTAETRDEIEHARQVNTFFQP